MGLSALVGILAQLEYGSTHSQADCSEDGTTLTVDGAQVIGWVCTPIPFFPSFDAKDVTVLSPNSK